MTFYRAKPLIRVDSPLYARRLARELNSLPDGYYVNGVRYSRARADFRYPCPSILAINSDAMTLVNVFETFSDAYGRTVVAPRSPSR